MKKLIRLTESDLHKIVKESVKNILINEIGYGNPEEFLAPDALAAYKKRKGHNEDYMEAKQIIDGMDFEDVKTLPERDPRFSFGALNGSEGEGMIDLNFKGILVTVKGIAKVMDNFEKYDEGGQFLGVEG